MSTSRQLDQKAIADHISDLIDYFIDLIKPEDKERVLVGLRAGLHEYFDAYIAFFPMKPSRDDSQPKIVAAIPAYNYILAELLDKTAWRRGMAFAERELEEASKQVELKLAQLLLACSKNEGSYLAYLKGASLIGRLVLGGKIEDNKEKGHLDTVRLLLQNRDNPKLQKELQSLITALNDLPVPQLKRQKVSGHADQLESDLEYTTRVEHLIDEASLTKEQLAAKKKEERLKRLKALDPKGYEQEKNNNNKVIEILQALPLQQNPLPQQPPLVVPPQQLVIELREHICVKPLKDLSDLANKKYPDVNHPWHKAAMAVHEQADLLNQRLMANHSHANLIDLQTSLTAAIAVVNNPTIDKYNALNTAIANCSDGSSFWLKLLGALTALAGLVFLALSAAGAVFTAGASIAAGCAAGAALTTCGATMFYFGTQGPLANSLTNLATLTNNILPKP